jgi:hypothetical protein
MLRKGKTLPAFAVRLAEARTQQGIAKTFGRSVVSRGPRCPYPDCTKEPEPCFCATHWQLLDSTMRREVLTELRGMRDRGQKTPSEKMRELFRLCIRDMLKALGATKAQQLVARVPLDALTRPVKPG